MFFNIIAKMIFSLLEDDDKLARNEAEIFLLQRETYCVSLNARFLQKDSKIYILKDDEGKIAAVFSYSSGGQLLFCARSNLSDDEKILFRLAVGKAIDDYFPKIFSVMGTGGVCSLISRIAENHLCKKTLHEVDFDLMVFDGDTLKKKCGDAAEKRTAEKHGAENRENFLVENCSVSELEEIFPLQKSYELEEVVFSEKNFNEAASRLILKKNLERKRVFALKKDGKIVSKLSVNARGKNCVQLGGVFTASMFRKQGFAKFLLLNFCRKYSENRKKIVLFVKKSNLPALALYKSCGFKKISDYKIAYF